MEACSDNRDDHPSSDSIQALSDGGDGGEPEIRAIDWRKNFEIQGGEDPSVVGDQSPVIANASPWGEIIPEIYGQTVLFQESANKSPLPDLDPVSAPTDYFYHHRDEVHQTRDRRIRMLLVDIAAGCFTLFAVIWILIVVVLSTYFFMEGGMKS